jgi:hypothetical protein
MILKKKSEVKWPQLVEDKDIHRKHKMTEDNHINLECTLKSFLSLFSVGYSARFLSSL